MNDPFCLQKGNVFAVPVTHYNMEMAAHVRQLFLRLQPDCVAVEFAETMQLQLLHAASRLPDVSIAITYDREYHPLYYMCEPCDAGFEALRSALENQIPAYCIDLDVDFYPEKREMVPDPYAIRRIGLGPYYQSYLKHPPSKDRLDHDREMYMARKLKELSLRYDRILFVGGMAHVENILNLLDRNAYPILEHAQREVVELCTLTEKSCNEVMAEYGWISKHYEEWRQNSTQLLSEAFSIPDRQKWIYYLYKAAVDKYIENTGNQFPIYNLRNIMKYMRNYALLTDRLTPDLFQVLTAAKGCVDHNYAYEVWMLASEYSHRRNIDNLNELDLSIEDVWGHSKIIRFHMREKSRKSILFQKRSKDKSQIKFQPPGPFSLCSYPPEDLVIENFGNFLKKKGTQLLTEEAARTIPFSTSIEDGLDMRETIRHWAEKKLYVKAGGKPPGGVGSVVMIFDEDKSDGDQPYHEKYPWRMTWLGEHQQESDMALYATPLTQNVVGPGISRCEYGGFMMSYPPRRMFDVWNDPDYEECTSKAEVLLMAAIDYAIKPVIVYVASKPPRPLLKSYARRFGKKIVYIPSGQLSPITLNKLRAFHVLDGHEKRNIAGEYIY